MSDDIVTRLRHFDGWFGEIASEALIEIERLRKEIAKWQFHAEDLWRALEVQKGMDFITETAKGALDRYDQAVRGE